VIPPRSPRANTHTEWFVLGARTEVTAWMLIFGDLHLPSILAEYGAHYNGTTIPIAAASSGSASQPPPRRPFPGAIKRRAVLGGLINEYQRAA
jgi:hypothetical protein